MEETEIPNFLLNAGICELQIEIVKSLDSDAGTQLFHRLEG